MAVTAGKFYGDKDKDKGLQTSEDAKFYQVSSKIEKPFSNEGKTLVLQFSVKHEQNIDCGGGYIKLFPADVDPKTMNGDSPYHIMFGPDICGPGTKKVHVIFTYKKKNLLTKKDIRCKDDEMTHLYTLILNHDNTYEVRIDGEKVESGELEADWDFLAPKKIKDPEAKKPDDWVDNAKMDDPEDKKPEDWDKPELIPDPEAENPEYVADDSLYKFDNIGLIGFEIWQVKSGTIFDNILVSDSVAEAEEFAKQTFEVTKVDEKKMKDKLDEEERKKQEEEDKKRKAEEDAKKKDEPEDEDKEDDDDEEEEKIEKEKEPTDDKTEEEPKKDEL